jgi:hypothetical protein
MEASRHQLTVFVNSCDAYRDCWPPFCTRFARYWADCPYPVMLNTWDEEAPETPLPVTATRLGGGTGRPEPPWGARLIDALGLVTTPYVLYLQEDYFFHAPVDTDAVERFRQKAEDLGATCLRIVEPGGAGPLEATDDPEIMRVDRRSKYFVSMQAGIWPTQTLRDGLRRHESVHAWELFSHRRLLRQGATMYCLSPERFPTGVQNPLPYSPTGIQKGRWREDIVLDLFQSHGIDVDYSLRGFYERPPAGPSRRPTPRKVVDRIRSLF